MKKEKTFMFHMVSRKSGTITTEKEFTGKDGNNMTALTEAIIKAKRWGKENGFRVKMHEEIK